jgi:hypothetical protein
MKKTTSVCRRHCCVICAHGSGSTHVLADDSGNADKTAIKTTADKNVGSAEIRFGNQSGKESIGI